MMARLMRNAKPVVIVVVLLALAGLLGWRVWLKLPGGEQAVERRKLPVPVEVAAVERGSIALRRTFSGTLEALAGFTVAAKVGGLVESVSVDIGDAVERGQVVAQLDDDEFEQAVALAEAELAVATANLAETAARLEVAQRELDRVRTLSDRGIASESRLDTVVAEQAAADAAKQVAAAQVKRAEANLATAKIRLGYTRVTATWVEGDAQRVVAERYVDPGDTVSANQELVSIVEIDPIVAVIFVTEVDYGRLSAGQHATLTTDAYPGRTFEAEVSRVSPVFRAASRQARVELLVSNAERALKPGMFVRATIVLATADDAVIVPQSALTRRQDTDGVFLVDEQMVAHWRPVEIGIREGERVQVTGEGMEDFRGRGVVTLGQQLLDDGAAVVIPEDDEARGRGAEASGRGGEGERGGSLSSALALSSALPLSHSPTLPLALSPTLPLTSSDPARRRGRLRARLGAEGGAWGEGWAV